MGSFFPLPLADFFLVFFFSFAPQESAKLRTLCQIVDKTANSCSGGPRPIKIVVIRAFMRLDEEAFSPMNVFFF